MSSLKVSKINGNALAFNYFNLQEAMKDLAWHNLEHVNWVGQYPYKPLVSFQIAHSGDSIYLHYTVEEEYVKAQYVRTNESIWEDSCVEFFISFDNKVHYYNLEFNVLGTGLIGYGNADRDARVRLDSSLIEQVSTATSVVSKGGDKSWAMIMVIPVAIFKEHNVESFDGLKADANFYKCGDSLPTPHFVSWAKIDNPTPDFHLPHYFGSVEFE